MMEWIESFNEEAVTADGFDDAIIGMAERSGQLPVVAYDWSKCIQILMERDGMDYEDAEEFFAVNVIGGWVGDSTPIYVTLLSAGTTEQEFQYVHLWTWYNDIRCSGVGVRVSPLFYPLNQTTNSNSPTSYNHNKNTTQHNKHNIVTNSLVVISCCIRGILNTPIQQ